MMTDAERLQEWVLQHPRVSPTLSECVLFLDGLDKSSLDPQHKEILQSLMDEKGCVFKVSGDWRWFHEGGTVWNDIVIPKMIDLGLLDIDATPIADSGMTAYAFVTDEAIEALKQ